MNKPCVFPKGAFFQMMTRVLKSVNIRKQIYIYKQLTIIKRFD